MKNQLHAQGKMFGLNFQPVTKAEVKVLRKSGRKSDLYEDIRKASNNENALYGFYQWKGKPSFELFLNGVSIDLRMDYKTKYEIRYLPVQGLSKKLAGEEIFYLVTEKGFKNGNSYVEFTTDYQANELVFEVNRMGMYNGMICSLIRPKYIDMDFEVVWNWSGFSSEYILSTKGKIYKLD